MATIAQTGLISYQPYDMTYTTPIFDEKFSRLPIVYRFFSLSLFLSVLFWELNTMNELSMDI